VIDDLKIDQIKIYIVFFIFSLLISSVVYLLFPDHLNYILQEDDLVENISACFYFFSFLFAGKTYVMKNTTQNRIVKIIFILGLIGFLEEISYGERVFGLFMPHIAGVKIDAAHDLVKLVYIKIKDFKFLHNIYLYLIISIFVGIILVSLRNFLVMEIMPKLMRKPPYMFLLIFAILLLLSQLVDIRPPVYHQAIYVMEEVLEMNASIALFFAWLSLPKIQR